MKELAVNLMTLGGGGVMAIGAAGVFGLLPADWLLFDPAGPAVAYWRAVPTPSKMLFYLQYALVAGGLALIIVGSGLRRSAK